VDAFNRLLARTAKLDIARIDAERVELVADATVDIESLRTIAWNDALRSGGYEDGCRSETRAQKFFRALA
jgi:hypothetical protein